MWLHVSTTYMAIFRPFGQHKIQNHNCKLRLGSHLTSQSYCYAMRVNKITSKMFPVHTSRFAYYFIMYDVTHTSHLGLKVGNDTSVSSFDVELLICGFLFNG